MYRVCAIHTVRSKQWLALVMLLLGGVCCSACTMEGLSPGLFPTIVSTEGTGPQVFTPTRETAPTPMFTPEATPPAPDHPVPQYTLDVALNYADRYMAVTQTVVVHNHSPDAWHEVVFAVPPAHYEDVFTLHDIKVNTGTKWRTASYALNHTMLHITPTQALVPETVAQIQLVFEIHIPPVAPSGRLPEGNLGAGEHLIQAGDWHPTLVPYRDHEGWQTWEYYPVGDPNIYSTSDYTVSFTADLNTVIAAPGVDSREGNIRRYHLENARCFAFLASPRYRFFVKRIAGVDVRVYYLPGYAGEARVILNTLADAIPLFIEYYGPYPTGGLVVAQNAYLGAMEYSGLVSMSNAAFESYDNEPFAALRTLTVHELAHQWWYGAVGNDQVHEPWLDESFAKYSEYLFYERYHPDIAELWWDHLRTWDWDAPLNSSIYDFEDTSEYMGQVYAQGAHFLAGLRREMGEWDFFAFVQDYRKTYEWRIVTGDDFFATLKMYTDKDLSELLEPYFESPETLIR